LADDHVHVKVAPDGRVFAVVKTEWDRPGNTTVALFVRSVSGEWSRPIPVVVKGDTFGTRPILQIDPTNDRLYVFYANVVESPSGGTIEYRTADMNELSFGAGRIFLGGPGRRFNDPTGSKQAISADSGILVVAKDVDSETAFYDRKDLLATDVDGDGWSPPDDCDDSAPDVNPGQREIPGNDRDDDCSPATPDDEPAAGALDRDTGPDASLSDARPGAPARGHDVLEADAAAVADPEPPAPPPNLAAETGRSAHGLIFHFDEGSGRTTLDSVSETEAVLGATSETTTKRPSWVPEGRFGAALEFDGENDQIRVPSNPSIEIAGSFTVEAWVARRMTASTVATIVNKGTQKSARNYRLRVGADGLLGLFWELPDGTNRVVLGQTAIVDSSWHHVAGVFDAAAEESRLYVDGRLDARARTPGRPGTSADQLLIGASTVHGSAGFQGRIDEVRVSAGALYRGDFDPPRRPFSSSSIRLSWSEGREDDLAGYNVYRSATAGGPYTKVNPSVLRTARHEEPRGEGPRCYVVTAVDTGGNESAHSAEVCVEAG
jgi:hypothetical protein